MQIGRKFLVFTSGLILSAVLGACQTLDAKQGDSDTSTEFVETTPGFESAGMVDAATFLGADLMSSDLHRVYPEAWNDGYANTYKIETPKHLYVVQGTGLAKTRIREIAATEELRHQSTGVEAGKAVVERTVNLVATPARALGGIAERFGKVENTGDALMVVPSGAAEIAGHLGDGLKELGITGWRITTGAAGTRCQGINGCAAKASEDIWSGVNSLAGKHQAAKEIHAELGTDPYTENKVLQRQVNRLAYTDAYISTATKVGYTWSGVRILDPLATGVGYYNNGEFVATYEDARKYRRLEKKQLRAWGVSENVINELYSNEAFTHLTRSRLTKAVSTFGTNTYKVRMIEEAASSSTRFVAESRLRVYLYLAELVENDTVKAFVADLPSAVAVGKDGTLILPFAVDYIKWTKELAPTIESFSQLSKQGKPVIHVLGTASPMFKQEARTLGVRVIELGATK
jgi:hypothetical protein